MCTCVGHDRVPCRNPVLGGARIPPREKGNFEDILDMPAFPGYVRGRNTQR